MAFEVLDLFSGAGGAAAGYARAGFTPFGVDIKPQPRYPFPFLEYDALEILRHLIDDGRVMDADGIIYRLEDFDFIHASPPCQGYSKLRHVHKDIEYPELIEPTRELLQETGLPWVIENVEGAPLIDPITLCGSHFGLSTVWEPYGKVGLRRHRLFESNMPLPDPGPHDHTLLSVPVYGHGPPGGRASLKGPGHAQAAREVMRIDWMQRHELDEAIPPPYAEYIGTAMRRFLSCTNCDGRFCMDCVLRYVHDECRNDCPMCCTQSRLELAA